VAVGRPTLHPKRLHLSSPSEQVLSRATCSSSLERGFLWRRSCSVWFFLPSVLEATVVLIFAPHSTLFPISLGVLFGQAYARFNTRYAFPLQIPLEVFYWAIYSRMTVTTHALPTVSFPYRMCWTTSSKEYVSASPAQFFTCLPVYFFFPLSL